jgi:hypothetical protein
MTMKEWRDQTLRDSPAPYAGTVYTPGTDSKVSQGPDRYYIAHHVIARE